MSILRERQSWRRPPKVPARRGTALSLEECERVRRVLWSLRAKHGDWNRVARALGCNPSTLRNVTALMPSVRPSGGLAIRAARALGVSVESLLDDSAAMSCPMCGRSG